MGKLVIRTGESTDASQNHILTLPHPVLPFCEPQQLFPQRTKLSNRVLFFAFQWVAGKSMAFHGIAALPAVNTPLPQFFVLFLCRHHGNILSYSYFAAAYIRSYAMRLKAVKY